MNQTDSTSQLSVFHTSLVKTTGLKRTIGNSPPTFTHMVPILAYFNQVTKKLIFLQTLILMSLLKLPPNLGQ